MSSAFTLSVIQSYWERQKREVTRSDLYFTRIILAALLRICYGEGKGREGNRAIPKIVQVRDEDNLDEERQ